MNTVRRVYVYLVAFASLMMLANGTIGLARALLLAAIDPDTGVLSPGLRSDLTFYGGLTLVGLLAWLVHWTIIGRLVRASVEERAATLRRLYFYAVLAVMALMAAWAAHRALDQTLRLAIGGPRAASGSEALLALPRLAVALLLWIYHRHYVTVDRAAAGERGGAATVRRWYVYVVAFIGLIALLSGASGLVQGLWRLTVAAVDPAVFESGTALAGAAATTLVGLALWLSHWLGLAAGAGGAAGEESTQDRQSILLPVYLFLALGVTVATSLVGVSQLLFYGLSRLLGVAEPGGVGGSLALAMARPVAWIAVYGLGWLYHRRAIAEQAAAQRELPRQAGVRRLYTYFVALVALSVLAAGAGGVLWTLADLATNAPRAVGVTDWWREQFSLYGTLLLAGLPVWFGHWGPVSAASTRDESASLARRIYIYVTLLAGVLTLLGSATTVVWQVLNLLTGEATPANAVTNMARALAVASVAGVVVYYHVTVLRRDVAAEGRAPAPSMAPMVPEAIASVTPAQVAGPARSVEIQPVPLAPEFAGHTRYGVVRRVDGTDIIDWYATAGEAAATYDRLTAAESPPDWLALIRVERETSRHPIPGPPAAEPDG